MADDVEKQNQARLLAEAIQEYNPTDTWLFYSTKPINISRPISIKSSGKS